MSSVVGCSLWALPGDRWLDWLAAGYCSATPCDQTGGYRAPNTCHMVSADVVLPGGCPWKGGAPLGS